MFIQSLISVIQVPYEGLESRYLLHVTELQFHINLLMKPSAEKITLLKQKKTLAG